MFCKNCGSNLKDGSTFCHNCGSMINNQTVNNTADVNVPNSAPMPETVPMADGVPAYVASDIPISPNAQNTMPYIPAQPQQVFQGAPNVPPVYNAPINQPMYQSDPAQNIPIQNVPMQNVPVQNVPMQNVPVQNIPMQYPPNVQPYGYMPYPVVTAPKKKLGAFDILALIFGIIGLSLDALGIMFAPAALIFGIIARKKSKSGMALAGIILGSIGIVVSILAILAAIFLSETLLDSFFDSGLYF